MRSCLLGGSSWGRSFYVPVLEVPVWVVLHVLVSEEVPVRNAPVNAPASEGAQVGSPQSFPVPAPEEAWSLPSLGFCSDVRPNAPEAPVPPDVGPSTWNNSPLPEIRQSSGSSVSEILAVSLLNVWSPAERFQFLHCWTSRRLSERSQLLRCWFSGCSPERSQLFVAGRLVVL